MNKHEVKGAIKEAAGKIQKEVGDLTDNKSQELKGALREAEGKVQKNYGEAVDVASDKIEEASKGCG